MARRDLTLRMRVKNAMQVGLARARNSLGGFASSVAGVARRITRIFSWAAAGIAGGLGVAMVKAQEFNKQIAQVATISDVSTKDAARAVRRLSAEFGLAKDALTKGLYDALSAGVPSDNAFDFLRIAAKAAVAGATDTARSVDFLTTALNAFQMPVEKAEQVADTLFTTVRLGKTTVEELAASFAQVGPLASASGVAFEEVMAAAATLTKQGTPTTQAMTQIRAAIIAMNRTLGDGWSSTMTLQDGMERMRQMAGGSNVELQKLTGRVEGMSAILGITGHNAASAAEDLRQVANGAGAMNAAFEIANQAAPLDKLRASLANVMMVIGDKALETFGPAIERGARAIADFAERIDNWAASEKLAQVRETIEGIIDAISVGGDTRNEMLIALADLLKASMARGAELAGQYLMQVAPVIGRLLGEAAKSVLSRPMSGEIKDTAAELGIDTGFFSGTFGFMRGFTEEQKIAIQQQIIMNREAKMFARLGLDAQKNIEGQTAKQVMLAIRVSDVSALAAQARGAMATPPDVSRTVSRMDDVAGAVGRAANATQGLAASNRHVAESADEMADAEAKALDRIVNDSDEAAEDVLTINRDLTVDLEDTVEDRVQNHKSKLKDIVDSELSGANSVRQAWRETNREIVRGGTLIGAPGSARGRGEIQLVGGLPSSGMNFSRDSMFGSGINTQLSGIHTTLRSIERNEQRLLGMG